VGYAPRFPSPGDERVENSLPLNEAVGYYLRVSVPFSNKNPNANQVGYVFSFLHSAVSFGA
jgi:hypothetical protein